MSEKIKIVHLTSVHRQGDIRIFQKECVSLVEFGYDVSFVVPRAEDHIDQGVKIIGIVREKPSRIHRMWTVVNAVYKKAVELNADIYHLHDPELLRIAPKLKKLGKIVIYDAHEDLPRQLLSKPYLKRWIAKPMSYFVETLENKTVRKLDAIVTATPFIRDRFLKVNPQTVDINNFPLEREIETAEVDNLTERERAICYIGGISKIRGIHHVVRACGIAEVPLYLAGEFPVGLKEELMKIDGWQFVKELGFISREEALKIKAKTRAGIVTFLPVENHINAQPNKIFEYMASGLPVIGSDFELWKKIIVDYDCGLCVDPTDPKEIANAIIQIVDHPEKVKSFGENGRRMVREKFNWNAEKVKLAQLYSSLSKNVFKK